MKRYPSWDTHSVILQDFHSPSSGIWYRVGKGELNSLQPLSTIWIMVFFFSLFLPSYLEGSVSFPVRPCMEEDSLECISNMNYSFFRIKQFNNWILINFLMFYFKIIEGHSNQRKNKAFSQLRNWFYHYSVRIETTPAYSLLPDASCLQSGLWRMLALRSDEKPKEGIHLSPMLLVSLFRLEQES
jgi:hypothetical protein